MPTYEWTCDDCEHRWDLLVPYDRRDDAYPCPDCGTCNTTRRFPAPAVMGVALPDGTKRKGFAEMREAINLTKEKAVARTDAQRKELAGEIRKLGIRTEKE